MTDGFVFCCGFPKCGTTTVSMLVDILSECKLHPDKEPGMLIEDEFSIDKYCSSFGSSEQFKYCVDFTTIYGLPENRKLFLDRVEKISERFDSRVIICLRDPYEQILSNIKHKIRSRQAGSGRKFSLDQRILNEVVEESLRDQDYSKAILDAASTVGEKNVFIVKFEDLQTVEGQEKVVDCLSLWLGLPVTQPIAIKSAKNMNSSDAAKYYPGFIKPAVDMIKSIGFHHYLSFTSRARIRSLLGVKYDKITISDEVKLSVKNRISNDGLSVYKKAQSGPLRSRVEG